MRLIFVFLIAEILISKSFSQERTLANEFGFRSDNDAYLGLGQDHYYTNGLFITLRHASNRNTPTLAKKTWEAEIGQYMYNAYSGDTENLQEVDRPFAAYLYGGVKFNWFTTKEAHFQAGLQVGTVGPRAYGRELQEALHAAIGFYTIHGWEYQIGNEIGVNSAFAFSKLLSRKWKNDLTLNTSLNIGNSFSGAGTGLLYRTGRLNKLFNSASYNSRIGSTTNDSTNGKESFFYAKPMINFVAYNATIQGGMFAKNKGPITFTPNRLLFSQELGYTYAKNRWTLNLAVIFQTKELKQQLEAQQYGSASFYYRFN